MISKGIKNKRWTILKGWCLSTLSLKCHSRFRICRRNKRDHSMLSKTNNSRSMSRKSKSKWTRSNKQKSRCSHKFLSLTSISILWLIRTLDNKKTSKDHRNPKWSSKTTSRQKSMTTSRHFCLQPTTNWQTSTQISILRGLEDKVNLLLGQRWSRAHNFLRKWCRVTTCLSLRLMLEVILILKIKYSKRRYQERSFHIDKRARWSLFLRHKTRGSNRRR